jgi:hypothetical protein
MKITYTLSEPAKTLSLVIKNSSNTTIDTYTYETGKPAGLNTLLWNAWWNGVDDAFGYYYYELTAGTYTVTIAGTDADDVSFTQSANITIQ